MCGTIVWLLVLSSSAAPPTPFGHVRSDQASIRTWIAEGYEQSTTFRALVDEIDRLPGIVYIEGTLAIPHGLDGALLHSVAGSRELPLLRIQLRLSLSRAVGIATLAHELQHVMEVLRGGRMSDASAMAALFAALDEAHDRGAAHFETEEARQVTARVLHELGQNSRR